MPLAPLLAQARTALGALTRRLWRTLALSAAASLALAHTAHAGEIILYEHAKYGGARVVLKSPTPNFISLGFNDRVSSMVVVSGRWELCTDADFQGQCTVFARGNYPGVDRRLNDRFSSARDLDDIAMVRPPAPPKGVIELYEKTRFRGRMLPLAGDQINLGASGFDDTASSVIVREGTWELCTDVNFQGQCKVFGPGQYPDLGSGVLQEVSSARWLEGGVAQGWRPAPPTMRRPEAPPARLGVELFAQPDFDGANLRVEVEVNNLRDAGFNDRAQSLIIFSGRWELCTDSRFRGQCVIYGPGRYPRLGELSGALSSLRQVQ